MFGRDKVGRYLNLDWNQIMYGPKQKLAKCYALEIICPGILADVFQEILARIFFTEKISFPFGVGELRPPYKTDKIKADEWMAIINAQEQLADKWTGFYLYHLYEPQRCYKNTQYTIEAYILRKLEDNGCCQRQIPQRPESMW